MARTLEELDAALDEIEKAIKKINRRLDALSEAEGDHTAKLITIDGRVDKIRKEVKSAIARASAGLKPGEAMTLKNLTETVRAHGRTVVRRKHSR